MGAIYPMTLFIKFKRPTHIQSIKLLAVLLSLVILTGCTDGLFNEDLKQYNLALAEGEFQSQMTLAGKIIKTDSTLIAVSQAQIDNAKTSFKRLNETNHAFADVQKLTDAQTVLAISPNTELAKKALRIATEQQNQQQKLMEQLARLNQIETGFPENFHLSPLHKKVHSSGVKLPSFVDGLSERYYLGALNKQMKNKVLNDYQIQQLTYHQTEVLEVAFDLSEQFAIAQNQAELSPKMSEIQRSLHQVITFHRQTMDSMLVSLLRNGIKAAEKSYHDITKVAVSQMTRGNFDKVWERQISPLTRKQWQVFDRSYLQPISTVRRAILTHNSKTDDQSEVLSQTFPHAKLTHKYFWPKTGLEDYTNQAPARKLEAKKISKVLDGIKFDSFEGINQSYQNLVIPG